MFEVRFKILK